MTSLKNAKRGRVLEVIAKYGKCMGAHFHGPQLPTKSPSGCTSRTAQARCGQLAGDPASRSASRRFATSLSGSGTWSPSRVPTTRRDSRTARCTSDRSGFYCGRRWKSRSGPDIPMDASKCKDLRSPLPSHRNTGADRGRWIYRITAEGEYKNPRMRVRAITQDSSATARWRR